VPIDPEIGVISSTPPMSNTTERIAMTATTSTPGTAPGWAMLRPSRRVAKRPRSGAPGEG
jgi:hypothetical protein